MKQVYVAEENLNIRIFNILNGNTMKNVENKCAYI